MNKWIVGFLVIVLGGVAGWYVMKGRFGKRVQPATVMTETTPMASGAATPVPATGTATVSYTGTAFSPKTITVKQGVAVTFVNNGSTTMWVVTDMHPTHRLLPSFNEGKAVGKGGTYTYTFTKVGTWPYHNEENVTVGGAVVVE